MILLLEVTSHFHICLIFRYFNYRTTRFLAEEGFYKFHNWFDDRAWYPLGRIIGGTIYPGRKLDESTSAGLKTLFRCRSSSLVWCSQESCKWAEAYFNLNLFFSLGLMITSAVLYHVLHFFHITIDIRNVCVFLAPLFSSFTAIVTYHFTKELKVRQIIKYTTKYMI